MASPLSGLREGLWELAKQKRERPQQELDQAIKYAQLAESGYTVRQQPRGFFGGSQMVLEKEPGFQGLKDLQRQELQDKLEMNKYKKKAYQQYFGGGVTDQGQSEQPMLGQGTAVGQPKTFGGGNQQAFVMKPDGTFGANPLAMNEKERLQAEKLQREQDSALQAEKNKEENLRMTAESNLQAIQEAKKGKRFFGPMGDIPSQFDALAMIRGEYGDRAKWEANINKVLSGKVLDVMNEMKNQSKTGATGFGALNESELKIIQGASTVLNRKLSPKDAEAYLTQMEQIQQKLLNGGSQKPSGGNNNFNSPEEADASGLPVGTVVTVQGKRYQI